VHGGIAPSQVYIRSNDPRFSTWEEVVAYAPDHGGLIFGYGAGPLDLEGLTIRNLERAVGVRFHSVAADDGRERYGSILEGRTDLLIEQPGDVRALLESGQIKPILTLWSERIRGFESVPTHYEMGADFTPLLRIRSLAVHRDTPPDRLTVLRRAFQAAFNSEGFQRYLRDDWLDLVRGPLDPIALLAQEIETYRHLSPSILVPEKTVRIGTPPPGSLFFEVGSGMAAVITGHSPMQAGVQPFTGNTAYLEALDAGEIELGVNGAFDFFAAYHRTDPRYTVASDVRVLQRGAAIRAGLLVRDDSAIRDLGGLAGKRVPSGFEPQRVVAALMDANLANAGLSWDDVEAVPVLNTSESIQALAAGWLDVAVGAVGAPEVEAADAAIPGGIRFLSLDTSPDAIARMHEIASFGVGWADAGSAAGARQDTALVSYDIYLTASKDLSDNAAYEIVRALWDFEQELLAKGTQFAGWTRERAADPNAVIPYHPGALRFYRERRAWADSWE